VAGIQITSVSFEVNEVGLQEQTRPILRTRHSSLTRRTEAQAKINVPVRTGHLGRSIREDPQVWKGPFHVSGGVTAHAEYAAAVHNGRNGNGRFIYPRNGTTLKFTGRDGRTVFAPRVRMGSTKPRPFLLNAARQAVASDPYIS
jgi:hypothetical protein